MCVPENMFTFLKSYQGLFPRQDALTYLFKVFILCQNFLCLLVGPHILSPSVSLHKTPHALNDFFIIDVMRNNYDYAAILILWPFGSRVIVVPIFRAVMLYFPLFLFFKNNECSLIKNKF